MNYILSYNGIFIIIHIDLDVQDSSGNTPLHIAVETDSLEALDFLLAA